MWGGEDGGQQEDQLRSSLGRGRDYFQVSSAANPQQNNDAIQKAISAMMGGESSQSSSSGGSQDNGALQSQIMQMMQNMQMGQGLQQGGYQGSQYQAPQTSGVRMTSPPTTSGVSAPTGDSRPGNPNSYGNIPPGTIVHAPPTGQHSSSSAGGLGGLGFSGMAVPPKGSFANKPEGMSAPAPTPPTPTTQAKKPPVKPPQQQFNSMGVPINNMQPGQGGGSTQIFSASGAPINNQMPQLTGPQQYYANGTPIPPGQQNMAAAAYGGGGGSAFNGGYSGDPSPTQGINPELPL